MKALNFVVGLLAFVSLASAARGEEVTYYLTNPQGTPLATTDAQNNITRRLDQKPYGQGVIDEEAGIGYTGHVIDGETELVYMQQRYYDPTVGIFLSIDPVGVDVASGAHFNRYNYAYNNPYRYTDPDGRCPMCIGFLIGAGIEVAMQLVTQGKVDNWTAVGVSGAVGAITGGVGSFAGKAAISGTITATRAVTTTALAGGAAAATGKIVEGELTGKPASSKEVAVAAAAGAVGSGAGAKASLAGVARLETMAARSDIAGQIGRTTQAAVQQGGKIVEQTSGAEKAAQTTVDAVANYAEKKANQ